MEWIDVNDRLPRIGQEVWIAIEMQYLDEGELPTPDKMDYCVGIGWLSENYKEDAPHWKDLKDLDKWSTLNDWHEGQDYYKVTHWSELPEPKHPKL